MIKVQSKRIYWFFIYPAAALTFAAISILFILSARGYSIHFDKSRLSFEKTGMIIISSKPTGAAVFMGGRDTLKKTMPFFSVKIDRLSKGKYVLTIEKEGYYKWEKEVKVSPEMVTWANYVLLFAKNPKIEKTDFEGSFIESFPAKDSKNALFLTKTKDGEVLYKVQNSSGEKTILFETAKLAEDKRFSDIKIVDWSKDHRYALLLGNISGDRRYWAVNTESKSIEDLTAISPLKFEQIVFNTSNSEELFGSLRGELFKVSIRAKSISSVLEKDIVYFTFSAGGKIYYVRDVAGIRSLWQANADLSGKDSLSEAIPISDIYDAKISPKTQRIAMYVKNGSYLYLVTKIGEKNSLITVGKNITDFAWSDDGERIFYKEQGANIIVLEDDTYKKETQEYEATDTGGYQDILWYDSRHLLGRNGDKVTIMDFDGTNKMVLGDTLPSYRPFFSYDNGDVLFLSSLQKPEQTLLSRYKAEF